MTKSSASELAQLIDGLATKSGVVVVETLSDVALSRVRAADARQIIEFLEGLAWTFSLEDSSEAEHDPHGIGEDLEPYRLTISKPLPEDSHLRFLTCVGFAQWLRGSASSAGKVEVCRASATFETYGFVVAPWDSGERSRPSATLKSPRTLVRETTASRLVPEDIRPWLLQELSSLPWTDDVFATWAREAVVALTRSLGDEVNEMDAQLTFFGPPKVRLAAADDRTFAAIGSEGFLTLQSSARWVFENERETETKHRLLSMELGRSATGRTDVVAMVCEVLEQALEGARLTFQLGLEDLSRDTLKALADLRKTLGEEASKLADATRQLATGVAGAVFLGLGLVVARLRADVPKAIILLLAAVLVAYVTCIIIVNVRYIWLQQSIREEWRGRLYRFLTVDDYRRMVSDPAEKAENTLYIAMAVSGAVAIVLLIGIILLP